MNGAEFIKRVRKLAKQTGEPCWVDTKAGRGSHVRLIYAKRVTTVKHGEIGSGLLHDMLKQLGLKRSDIGM